MKKPHRKNKKPFFKILLALGLFLLLLITGGVLLYSFYPDKILKYMPKSGPSFVSNYVLNIKEKEFKMAYLVPVVKFKSYKYNYTYPELTTDRLVTLAENKSLLPMEFKDISTIEVSEIAANLNNDKILLLTPDQVDPKYRTININGQNFWQKTFDLKTYPLKKLVLEEKSAEAKSEDSKFVIFASGEIIPARAVDRMGFNKYENYTYVYDFFKNDIANADIAIGELENALLGNPKPCTGCTSFTGDDKVAPALKAVGYDWINLAGNHAGDAGQKAYENTLKLFSDLEVQTVGTGKNEEEVLRPAVSDLNGLNIGMLTADDIAYFYWDKNTNDSTYGTNSFSLVENGITKIDEARVKKITDIKAKYNLDYLIIYMSWGVEYTNKPTTHQKQLAHALIDAGADTVIASHPHWVQSIEDYNGHMIFYSMGNFIFDQTHTLETRQGYTTNLYFHNNALKNIELMPSQTCGYHQTGNDVTGKYLAGEVSLSDVYAMDDKKGCVYWQPKKLEENHTGYKQILERVYQHTTINGQ